MSTDKLTSKTATFLSLTSMIGAGIFIKVRTLNILAHNTVTPIIFLFFFFLLSILAFAYVLVKVIPMQTGDMGFMEWSKTFCSPGLHRGFCRFIRYLYYPISFFLFSTFGVLGLTGEKLEVFSTLLISLLIVAFFLFVNFVSFKLAKKIQILLSCLVLVPLFVIPMLGIFAPGGAEIHSVDENTYWSIAEVDSKATGLDSWGPWMILISGLPSLLFIYDGFYSVASLKSKLHNPKSLALVIITSMGIVTLVYIYVILGFNLGDPKYANFKNFRLLSQKYVLIDVFDLLICCASFMTLNSIVMGSLPQLKALNDVHRFYDEKRVRNSIFYKDVHGDTRFENKFSIVMWLGFKTFVCYVAIGSIMFLMTQYGLSREPIEIINALADIVTVFVFIILLSIIIGSFKKKGSLFRQSQLFRWCAIVSSSIILISLIYLFISFTVGTTGYAGSNIFNSWVKLITLISFLLGCYAQPIWSFLNKKINKKKFVYYPEGEKGSIIVSD